MNDPMWDLAALFLESEFTTDEEDSFLSYYESEQTPVSREKIRIYKILQDIIGAYGPFTKKKMVQILEIMESLVIIEL